MENENETEIENETDRPDPEPYTVARPVALPCGCVRNLLRRTVKRCDKHRRAHARRARRARADIMSSLGMVRTRSGGWE